MRQFLNELRHKPKRVKDQIAFLGASVVTGCIALVWLVSLQAQEVVAVPEDSIESLEESRGAFAQFFGTARTQLANVFSGAEEELLATTTLPQATTSSVIVPQLTPETARRLNPTPILIGTTSPGTTSVTE
jgi:hypothetical protein